jgi:hypothetical protein
MTHLSPYPAPSGRTARRLEWAHLPPHVRELVARRCGSEVVDAVSQTSGFTPGFASVLTCADGSKHFVKAASSKAQRMFAASYREEARKLATLPTTVPAPRLLWVEDGDWVVLGIEHVEARQPHRPWRADDLAACLDALEQAAAELTPPPAELELDTFEEEHLPLVSYWEHVRETRPELRRHDEAAALAADFARHTAGETVVHVDVRDDNCLVAADGRVWICDWNWPVLGAAWIDSLMMLIGPRGDGLDVERVIAERALLREVPAEAIDSLLALVTAYFFRSSDEPVPPTSPHIRDHQRWQGEVCWAWLAERRGWA